MENNSESKEVAVRGEMAMAAQEFFEALDHKEVIKQLESRIAGAWVYDIPIGGKRVQNLSKDGAVETAIALSQLSQGKFVIEAIPNTTAIHDYGDCIDAQVFAGLFTKGIENGQEVKVELTRVSGYCSQPKHKEYSEEMKRKKHADFYEIQHPRINAVHKAERNAFNKLIPEKLRLTIIAIAMKKGKVEKENGGSSKPAPRQTKKTEMSSSGSGSAFEAQLNEIAKLLADENLPENIRVQCDKAVKEGVTSKQAEAWMGTLKQAINRKKAEGGELNV